MEAHVFQTPAQTAAAFPFPLAGGARSVTFGGFGLAATFASLLTHVSRNMCLVSLPMQARLFVAPRGGPRRSGLGGTDGDGGFSGGKVGALHGVQAVDGVPRPAMRGAYVRGGHEAVIQTRQRGVAVHVMEDDVGSFEERRRNSQTQQLQGV